jgi:hypothetical protein
VRHLLLTGTVEPVDGIRVYLTRGELALAFAELLLEGAAHERMQEQTLTRSGASELSGLCGNWCYAPNEAIPASAL